MNVLLSPSFTLAPNSFPKTKQNVLQKLAKLMERNPEILNSLLQVSGPSDVPAAALGAGIPQLYIPGGVLTAGATYVLALRASVASDLSQVRFRSSNIRGIEMRGGRETDLFKPENGQTVPMAHNLTTRSHGT